MLTTAFVIMLILTILTGWAGEVWRGRYDGNSDMVRKSAQFWFLWIAALTVLLGIMRFA